MDGLDASRQGPNGTQAMRLRGTVLQNTEFWNQDVV
jgi:hypothetical protein